MKTFLAVTASLAFAATLAAGLAAGGCSSDDNAGPAATVLSNVPVGGACSQGAECASGVCGYPIKAACAATGVCVAQSNCTVVTRCACGGGPAFSECDDGVNAGEPVTGDSSCVEDGGMVDASADGGTDASDAQVQADAAGDAPSDAGHDAEVDAADAEADASNGDAGDAGTDAADATTD